MRVPAFAAEVVLAVLLARRRRSSSSCRARSGRGRASGPSRTTDLDDVAMAEPGAGDERVLGVRLEAVLRAPDRGDAALRVLARALGQAVLRDQRDGAVACALERAGEPGDAAADDEDFGLDRHGPGSFPERPSSSGSSAASALIDVREGGPYPRMPGCDRAGGRGAWWWWWVSRWRLRAAARAHIYTIAIPSTGVDRTTRTRRRVRPRRASSSASCRGPLPVVGAEPRRGCRPTPAKPKSVRRAHPSGSSRVYDVEYALVKAVIKAESGFNHQAVSPKGAQGLMQLMPATARAARRRRTCSARATTSRAGSGTCKWLLDRYGGNVPYRRSRPTTPGTQRVGGGGGIPNIPETREYLGPGAALPRELPA